MGRPGESESALLPPELAKEYNVSRETKETLEDYVSLLLRWQSRINLIGPATVEDVWHRHIADSLAVASLVLETAGGKPLCIADIGTGAGLPGIPLGLLLGQEAAPKLHLIDSNIKKAAFLREAIRTTGLPAHVHHCRVEDLEKLGILVKPTVVVSRALASLEKLCELTETWLRNGAVGLFQKGRHVDKELKETAHRDWLRYKVVQFGANGDGSIVKVTAKPGNLD